MPIDQSRPPAVAPLRKLGMEPYPWQVEVLDGDQPRLPLNCSSLSQLARRGLSLSLSREWRGRKREPIGRTQSRPGSVTLPDQPAR